MWNRNDINKFSWYRLERQNTQGYKIATIFKALQNGYLQGTTIYIIVFMCKKYTLKVN